MIRRAFWLGAGATAGILGYRRVTALGRRLSGLAPGLTPGLADPTRVLRKRRHAGRSTIRFARDVREGMDIYTSRHPGRDALPSGHEISITSDRITSDRHDRKDGR
jgi:hypothetical protein